MSFSPKFITAEMYRTGYLRLILLKIYEVCRTATYIDHCNSVGIVYYITFLEIVIWSLRFCETICLIGCYAKHILWYGLPYLVVHILYLSIKAKRTKSYYICLRKHTISLEYIDLNNKHQLSDKFTESLRLIFPFYVSKNLLQVGLQGLSIEESNICIIEKFGMVCGTFHMT